MEQKRLAIFINSLVHGGAQKIASVLVEELSKTFDVYLVLLENEIVYQVPEEIKVVTLTKNSDSLGVFGKLKLVRKYYGFCKTNKIDVSLSLLTQPNYISALTKLMGNKSKIILSEHTYQSLWRADQYLYARLKKLALYFLYNRADKIITVSKKIEEDLATNFKIKKTKLVTVYNPYDLDKIVSMSSETIDDIDFDNQFTFIAVGTLYHVKNQELLIRAFSQLEKKNIQLLIVGDGELRNRLERLVSSLGIDQKVKFIGFVSNPYKYVKNSDAFVLTSNNEGLPNVIIEALACGCPVVSTDCISGPREILAPGTSISVQLENDIEFAEYGILVPIKNEKLLTKAFKELIENPEMLKNYADRATVRASDFEASNSINNYVQTISSVLSN